MKGRAEKTVSQDLPRELREAGARPYVPHSTRPALRGAAHVVLRIRGGLPSLTAPRAYRVVEDALRAGGSKDGFRLLGFSVQRDRVHLVVRAGDRARLTRGMQGLMIRIAKRLNGLWDRRRGTVFADRYLALPARSSAGARGLAGPPPVAGRRAPPPGRRRIARSARPVASAPS